MGVEARASPHQADTARGETQRPSLTLGNEKRGERESGGFYE